MTRTKPLPHVDVDPVLLDAMVLVAMRAAIANGYPTDHLMARDVAEDLNRYHPELEKYPPEQLRHSVLRVRRANLNQGL